MEEGKAGFFLTVDAVDPYHATLGPFRRRQVTGCQLLDVIDDPFENPAFPASRGATVAGNSIASVPAPAVNLPGGLG